MPKWKPATPEQRRQIENSVRRAFDNLLLHGADMDGFNNALRRGETEEEKKAETALWYAPYEHFRDLSDSRLYEAILAGARRNDQSFFKRLGRVLAVKPKATNPKREASKLQRFLVEHWASCADGLPELFYLTLDGLVTVCDRQFTGLSTAGLDKTRRRLGLKSFPGSKLTVKEKSGKLVYYQPNQKPYEFTEPCFPWLLLQRSD